MNNRPAVVFSRLDDVHLISSAGPIKSGGTMFSFEEETRDGMPVDSLRVAEPEGKERGFWVWVIARNRPVVIQTEDFPAEGAQVLCNTPFGGISRRNIKLPIRSELNSATVMHRGSG